MLLLLCVAMVSGCRNSTTQNPKVFHYNQASGISSLDPAFSRDQATIWACHQLYNGLVQLDPQLEVRPCIARSWQVGDDGLSYTFKLRTDVYFHTDACFADSTRLVTAADVVYSLHRILDPHVASPGAWIFHDRVDTLAPFTAIDDSTVVIRLLRPFRPMLGLLSMSYCAVVPHEAIRRYGSDYRAHPVGTGPFRCKVWKEGSALILTRHPRYFEYEGTTRLPYLDGVRVSFIANKKSEYLAFKQGKLDFISGIDPSFIEEVLTPQGMLKPELSQDIVLQKAPYLNTEYLGMLMDSSSPLRDVRIRQALNYGIDRTSLIRFLRKGVGRPASNGFVPAGLPSFDTTLHGYSYDPVRARELIRASGYSAHPEPITLYVTAPYKDIALYAAKQWEQIGIQVKPEVVEGAILREWMSGGKAMFFRGSWIADYPDAENYLAVFYSHNGAPPNYTRFRDARYDRLYVQSLHEQVDSARYALYRAMDSMIITASPVIPLFYDEVLRFTHPRVKHLAPNGINLLDLTRVELE
jgi:oligopeptide transport system substrate-binding protein